MFLKAFLQFSLKYAQVKELLVVVKLSQRFKDSVLKILETEDGKQPTYMEYLRERDRNKAFYF